DLHAADPSSLLLLQFVGRQVASMRIVVLCACRNVDPAPTETLTATLTELGRESSTRVISLSGLSEQEIGNYVSLAAAGLEAGTAEAEALELLDEAMRSGTLADIPDAPGRLRFAHVLIRDALYESMTAARRIAMHRRAVAALEELYGDNPGPHLTELAHHAVAGSEFEKALVYARRAGDRALALLAYEEA